MNRYHIRVKIVYLLLILLCVPPAVADDLPDLGESAQVVLTPLDEQRIAEAIMREMSSSGEILNDVEVVDYLQALGYRLVSQSSDNRQRFIFFVVKDNTINAFAMPGGVIGVHTGLLLSSGSESELASVLAHEIGHVVQRHLARMVAQQQRDAWKSYLGLAFGLLAARTNPQLAGASMQAASAGAIQRQLDYTREHEREADRVGLTILQKSGFDTRAMPNFFEQLQRGTRFYDGGAPAFLRTHPLTTERIADVKNRVDQMPYRQVLDSPEFHYVRARIRAGQGSPQQAVNWFETGLKEKRYVSEAAQRYGLAVALMRANEVGRAGTEVSWLEANAPRHPMLENLAAHVELASGGRAEAEKRFRSALNIYPDHRGLIYGYVELLLASGQPQSALKLLKEKQLVFSWDPYLFELESQAWTQQGKTLLRHQAQGEAYYRRYNLQGAVEQMELAARSGDGDFYQLSIVEARLKQLRLLLAPPKEKGWFD